MSPHRPFDDEYRSFLDLLTGQISAAIASAKAQEEARERADALAKLDQAKTAFFSNISHEFRTPLTLLLGPIEDALHGNNGDTVTLGREVFESLYRNALRLLKLVNSLLDFSRVEAGRVEASYEPVDLGAYTRELASQFSPIMERGGLSLEIDVESLHEPVHVDREMWEKIVLNLLSNAFKFTLKGSVRVSLNEGSHEVELSVHDTGSGIPTQELPKVFQRFHRVQGAKSRTFEGSGIGLALVQELAKLHGGTVSVNSVLGEGSTFRVAVPKGTSHLPHDSLKAPRRAPSTRLKADAFVEEAARWLPDQVPTPLQLPQAEANAARRSILVVDDNSDMRAHLTRILAGTYAVRTAVNGNDALQSIKSHLPDLLISDVMMPEMNGFELIKHLRENEGTAHLPVIVLSARAGDEATVEGLEAGADDYLVKPFSAKELMARVQTQLSMVRLKSDLDIGRRELLARDEFLSIASHELYTPLTPLKTQLQLLMRTIDKGKLADLGPERLKRMVELSERQIDKLTRLVSDLLDVSRITSGKLNLRREKTYLAAIVRCATEQYAEQIAAAKCAITLELQENVVGDWDVSRIEQVVTNLLINTLKYAPAKPVAISVHSDGRSATLVVQDNGPGISKENLAKLFGRFERIGAPYSLGGLGLGLFISKQIVESHGGSIEVESILGQGARFSVVLPLAT